MEKFTYKNLQWTNTYDKFKQDWQLPVNNEKMCTNIRKYTTAYIWLHIDYLCWCSLSKQQMQNYSKEIEHYTTKYKCIGLDWAEFNATPDTV